MGTTDVYDIEWSISQGCKHNSAFCRLSFQNSGARVCMIYRGSTTSGNRFSNYKVDGDSILRMNHDQATQPSRTAQDSIDCLIVHHKSTWIGHQQLECRQSFGNHLIHRLFRSRSEVSDRHMKAIIDYRVSCCFFMP